MILYIHSYTGPFQQPTAKILSLIVMLYVMLQFLGVGNPRVPEAPTPTNCQCTYASISAWKEFSKVPSSTVWLTTKFPSSIRFPIKQRKCQAAFGIFCCHTLTRPTACAVRSWLGIPELNGILLAPYMIGDHLLHHHCNNI